MGREEFIRSWLEGKISSGVPGKKMREVFEGRDARDLKTIITRSTGLREPRKRVKDEVASPVKAAQAKPQDNETSQRWNIRALLSLAIATAIFIVAYFTFANHTVVESPPGRRAIHTLPDGSSVWLNINAKISYEPFTAGDTRNVILEGEGFFEVATGGPFKVQGEKGTVTVLGTSFNVQQTAGVLGVACYTGIVEVADENGHRVILKAGEYAELIDDVFSAPAPFDKEKVALWRWSGNVVKVE